MQTLQMEIIDDGSVEYDQEGWERDETEETMFSDETIKRDILTSAC